MEVPQRLCGVSFILQTHPHPAIPLSRWKLGEYWKKTRNDTGKRTRDPASTRGKNVNRRQTAGSPLKTFPKQQRVTSENQQKLYNNE